MEREIFTMICKAIAGCDAEGMGEMKKVHSHDVIIVVPVYRTELRETERVSL